MGGWVDGFMLCVSVCAGVSQQFFFGGLLMKTMPVPLKFGDKRKDIDAKELVQRIPTDKVELFSYPKRVAVCIFNICGAPMRLESPSVIVRQVVTVKKVRGALGNSLTKFICHIHRRKE